MVWEALKKNIYSNAKYGSETRVGDFIVNCIRKKNKVHFNLFPTEEILVECCLKYRVKY
jgi:hypothetical protein